MNLSYEIKSRGVIVVSYEDKTVEISGELVFDPPKFYADLSSLKCWDEPNDKLEITDQEKTEIVKHLTNLKEGTEITFD